MTYLRLRESVRRTSGGELVVGLVSELLHEQDEIVTGEAPLEGRSRLFVAALECGEASLDLGEVGEVVGVRTLRWITEK